MDNHVRGFDSRWWDGRLDDTDAFRFCYIKLGDGIWGTNQSSLTDIQYGSAGAKGLKRGMFWFWRYTSRGGSGQAEQAAWCVELWRKYSCELPLVLDFEDKAAPKGSPCRIAINAFGRSVARLVPDVMVYTAPWWWDQYCGKTRVNFTDFDPYACDLWNADPPPDTPLPGLWTDYAIRQYRLDWAHPSFNAGIDEDWARQSWWQKWEPLVKWDDMTPGEKDRVMGELAREHGRAA